MEFILSNYQWFFSGIGVFLIGIILRFLFKNKNSNTPIININNSSSNSTTLSNNSQMNKAEEIITQVSVFDIDKIKPFVKILFIDDDTKFKVINILKNAGWANTKIIKDVISLDDFDIKEANILFVDIKGVGKKLNCKDEGLGLALYLKKKYPLKKVIIYSAETKGERFHEALKLADDSLAKNADPYEFQLIVEKFAEDIYTEII